MSYPSKTRGCLRFVESFLSRARDLYVTVLVGRSVGPSVGLSHFASFALLGILRVRKFVFEQAPVQIITAPAQIITAPA